METLILIGSILVSVGASYGALNNKVEQHRKALNKIDEKLTQLNGYVKKIRENCPLIHSNPES